MTGGIDIRYRFEPAVEKVERAGDRVAIHVKNWKTLNISPAAPAHADAIVALVEGVTLERLAEVAGSAKVASHYLERFSRARLLVWDAADAEGPLARATSLTAGYRPREDAPPAEPLALSRFAYLRHDDAHMLLESGLVRAQLVLEPRGLAVLARSLEEPRTAGSDGFAAALWRLGFFEPVGLSESDARVCWEFHDLLMHEQSRFSRDQARLGLYRFEGKIPSAPAVKPAMPGTRIALPAVDPAHVRGVSGPLDEVQGRRQSIRSYVDKPLPLSALGEFLWRVGRTDRTVADGGHLRLMRLYPGGGAIHEIEFYVAVRSCEGLEPALHHYDGQAHALVRLDGSQKSVAAIVTGAAQAMVLEPGQVPPQAVIVLASRLPRLAWKYEGIAYRLALLNAGVVIELMYLVATDMRLAPCANGSGDSRLFEIATGLDPLEETALAEFALGVPA